MRFWILMLPPSAATRSSVFGAISSQWSSPQRKFLSGTSRFTSSRTFSTRLAVASNVVCCRKGQFSAARWRMTALKFFSITPAGATTQSLAKFAGSPAAYRMYSPAPIMR
jgi:hypothetical protein